MDEERAEKPTRGEMVQMVVAGIAMDPTSNMPIVILREIGGEAAIPIWIGLVEASAIATELEGVNLARPMTHDLLKNTLDALGAKLLRIEVNDLKDNTFYASLFVEVPPGSIREIDSRPSDAIALALRAGANIFVGRKVIDMSRHLDLSSIQKQEEAGASGNPGQEGEKGKESGKDKWTQILENLKPEDFGKYKM